MHQHQTTFENIVGKGEIACNKQFLLFPQCFLLNQIIVSPFVLIFDIISLFAAELEDPTTDNPFPNKPWFLRVCSARLLKTLWEKEKLLVKSNFSFSHSVFYSFRRTFCHFYQI